MLQNIFQSKMNENIKECWKASGDKMAHNTDYTLTLLTVQYFCIVMNPINGHLELDK